MKVKDVLVVGAGIAGCAVALALAKRGVPVTIVTSSFDQRAYHAPFIQHGQFEDKLRARQIVERENCFLAALGQHTARHHRRSSHQGQFEQLIQRFLLLLSWESNYKIEKQSQRRCADR